MTGAFHEARGGGRFIVGGQGRSRFIVEASAIGRCILDGRGKVPDASWAAGGGDGLIVGGQLGNKFIVGVQWRWYVHWAG